MGGGLGGQGTGNTTGPRGRLGCLPFLWASCSALSRRLLHTGWGGVSHSLLQRPELAVGLKRQIL